MNDHDFPPSAPSLPQSPVGIESQQTEMNPNNSSGAIETQASAGKPRVKALQAVQKYEDGHQATGKRSARMRADEDLRRLLKKRKQPRRSTQEVDMNQVVTFPSLPMSTPMPQPVVNTPRDTAATSAFNPPEIPPLGGNALTYNFGMDSSAVGLPDETQFEPYFRVTDSLPSAEPSSNQPVGDFSLVNSLLGGDWFYEYSGQPSNEVNMSAIQRSGMTHASDLPLANQGYQKENPTVGLCDDLGQEMFSKPTSTLQPNDGRQGFLADNTATPPVEIDDAPGNNQSSSPLAQGFHNNQPFPGVQSANVTPKKRGAAAKTYIRDAFAKYMNPLKRDPNYRFVCFPQPSKNSYIRQFLGGKADEDPTPLPLPGAEGPYFLHKGVDFYVKFARFEAGEEARRLRNEKRAQDAARRKADRERGIYCRSLGIVPPRRLPARLRNAIPANVAPTMPEVERIARATFESWQKAATA